MHSLQDASSSSVASDAATGSTANGLNLAHSDQHDRTGTSVIVATYTAICEPAAIESTARDIALEQSVEVPWSLICDHPARDAVVGKIISTAVEDVRSDDGTVQARIAINYPVALAAGQLQQVINLLYGNISMKPSVRLVDVTFPDELLNQFAGPRFGIDGLRKLLGVYGRPLLATALKPRGSTDAEFAETARQFALGGGDIVKDDHNLVDADFSRFQSRVRACQQAIAAANAQTGCNSLYFPSVNGSYQTTVKQIEFALAYGVSGVLIAPHLLGLENVRELTGRYPLVFMAHPTGSGTLFHDNTHGIAPGCYLGSLFRLAGCDITIFPNHGGRFSFSADTCTEIADAARGSLGPLAPIWPAPAGGMTFDTLPRMSKQYGVDSIFLIGGALLSDSAGVEAATRRCLQAIKALFPHSKQEVVQQFGSACELKPPGQPSQLASAVKTYLRQKGFRWEGRVETSYKPNDELPFRDVTRVELLGTNGEAGAFDLRYFEIAPNGYSSLEQHEHVHAIIGVRGSGELVLSDQTIPLAPLDVAYVPPQAAHQLRASTEEPFGFFCIVDRHRDRPRPVQ
jgi:ribulose-bisphosphate carboxylase large chain